MRVPGPFPAHLQDAPFTRAQALAAGVSGSRLRSRDVERVAHGHYRWIGPVTGATPPARPLATELSRLQDLAAMRPDVVVTGESVARLLGWPLPDDVKARVRPTVLRSRTRRVLREPGVRTRLVDLDVGGHDVVDSGRGQRGRRSVSAGGMRPMVVVVVHPHLQGLTPSLL